MATAAVVKDVGEIWTRLFDHRQFLSGEIKFHLAEFEENRADREVKHLFDILEKVSEIKDTQIKKLHLACDVHLPSFNAKLDVALSMCNRIFEEREKKQEDQSLIVKRHNRSREWEVFIEDMTEKCSRIDSIFNEKEAEFKMFYLDLEKKLNLRQ